MHSTPQLSRHRNESATCIPWPSSFSLVFASLSLLVLFGAVLPSPATAEKTNANEPEKPQTFAEALASGKTTLSLRYRFEGVDQDGVEEDAEASTLRSTLSYSTKPFRGVRIFLEAENVAAVFDDDNYNNAGAGSLNNGVRDRPVVADPELTEINQVFLEWKAKKADLKVGRQAINLANQRFVGAVAWRQNHQTFDAVGLTLRPADKANISYHYLNRAHRIFGDQLDMSSHLLHGTFQLGAHDTLNAYGYLLDYETDALVGLSTSTYGLRWTGKRKLDGANITYALEYAQQQDAADNPNNIDADYLLAEIGAGTPTFTVTVGYEALSGAPGDGAFSTPLATLHKFNGFADKFLRTPSAGLVDFYGSIGGKAGKFGWKLIYHQFEPDSEGEDYGTELDALATYKLATGWTLGFKAAFYDAEAFATDTDKVMLWSAYKFSRP